MLTLLHVLSGKEREALEEEVTSIMDVLRQMLSALALDSTAGMRMPTMLEFRKIRTQAQEVRSRGTINRGRGVWLSSAKWFAAVNRDSPVRRLLEAPLLAEFVLQVA